MEVTLTTGDLVKATSVVQRIVAGQNNMPILSNVLIEAGENNVTFMANDVEACVRCTVPAVGPAKPGQVTLPAEVLSRLARELPSESVTSLRSEELMVHIETRTGESPKPNNVYRLSGMPPEDFPLWPRLEAATTFEISQKALKRLIDRTIFAVAQQDPRKVFLGELMELKESRLRLVATDGKKLAWAQAPIAEIQGQAENAFIIPQKMLKELSGAPGGEGTFRISMAANQIGFDLDGGDVRVSYVSNRIEGRYPNYEVVVPRDVTRELFINADALVRILKRAAVVSEERNAPVVLAFEPNLCEVSATSYDLGSFSGSIAAQYDGPKFEMAFNYKYLLDTIKSLGSADVKMRIKAPGSPALFFIPDDPDVLCLIMPIKLSDIRPAASYEEDEGAPSGGEPPENQEGDGISGGGADAPAE